MSQPIKPTMNLVLLAERMGDTATRLRQLRASGIRPAAYPVCVLDRRCVEKSEQTVITPAALRMELQNYMSHGRVEHNGDWYHDWARTSRGTLSWNC